MEVSRILGNFSRSLALLGPLTLAGCTVNPVTGDRELGLVSTAEEIGVGEAQYIPSRQMQGGDFVLDPNLNDYVAEVGYRLADVSDRALPYEFVILNSSVPNAWALPGGKIAVNRGLLLELDSEAELAAVLGHEIVHAAARHGAQAMQRSMILQGALLATTVAARGDYSNLAIGAASVGAQLINQRYGRGAELEADLYGMNYLASAGYDPQAAVALQETFMRLSEGRSQDWLSGLFASHPPSTERVNRNRETAAALPGGGELGRDRYQVATQRIRETQPAYDAYDRGRTALAENRPDDAEQLAAEAMGLVPGEAQFHALAGNVDLARDRFTAAIDHYDDAIGRYDEFFYYHLQKGLAHEALGQRDSAELHLQTSIDLFPTAEAYYGLGTLAEDRGDRETALEHYRVAATANSPAGQAAQDALIRLDLPENPGGYLQLRTLLDSQGQLIVEVANPTRIAVTDLRLSVRYVDSSGTIQQTGRQLNRTLASGEAVRLATGIGPFTNPNAFQVEFESARVVTE